MGNKEQSSIRKCAHLSLHIHVGFCLLCRGNGDSTFQNIPYTCLPLLLCWSLKREGKLGRVLWPVPHSGQRHAQVTQRYRRVPGTTEGATAVHKLLSPSPPQKTFATEVLEPNLQTGSRPLHFTHLGLSPRDVSWPKSAL